MSYNKAFLASLLISCLLTLQGCSLFGSIFGRNSAASKAPAQVSKLTGKLSDEPKPQPGPELNEAERKVLYLAEVNVERAKISSNQKPVIEDLSTAQALLAALERSIGVPSSEVGNDPSVVKKSIKELDNENKKLKKQEKDYEKKMEQNRQVIDKLKGLVDTNIETEKSLMDQIKFWTWVAIILSIAIAVLVPGGMLIVKRTWSKIAEISWEGAKSAGNAMGELSKSLSDYLANVDKDEAKKLQEHLDKMPEDVKNYLTQIQKGDNPLLRIVPQEKRIQSKKS